MADKRKAAQASDADALAKRVRQDDAGGLVLGSRASTAQALVQKQQRTSALRSPVLALSGAHGAEVLDVKFSPDGSTIAAASVDRTISLWETYGENRNIGQLQGHKLAVTSIAWLPPREDTPAMLISSSADGTLALWDVSSGEKLRRLRGHRGIVNGVACSPTGRPLVASAADDGRVLLWDLDSRHPVEELDLGYPVTAVAFAEDATQLFVGGLDNAIRVFDLSSLRQVYMLQDTIASLALSRSGTHLLSTSLDDSTRIWDVRPFAPEPQPGTPSDPRLYRTLAGTMSGFENLLIKGAWSADGERVASGSADRTCTIWDVEKGTILYKLPGHRGTCTAVDLHPHEPIVVSASTDRTLLLGEVEPSP